jgi:hypothetical protein
MKSLIFGLALVAIASACNDNKSTTTSEATTDTVNNDTSVSTTTSADPKFQGVLTHYLHIKNALAADNSKDAAAGAKELNVALTAVNKSGFTPEQATSFADIEADIKEHAQHIETNPSNIKHQREHFDMLSKDVFDIVKAHGAGQTLYKTFCPMYNNKKGAIWLSEVKEIKNPYYGNEMLTCGEVQEELK